MKSAKVIGYLLLARQQEWSQQDTALVGEVCGVYGHAWAGFVTAGGLAGSILKWARKKRIRLLLLIAIVACMFIPLRLSVMAPAEIIANDPTEVRVSLEGVIDSIEVAPNESVKKGHILFKLDPSELQNRLDVARKARDVAQAEYRQIAQQAVFDPKSKIELVIRKGRLDMQENEVKYLTRLLDRVVVRSPRDGVAIFSNASDHLGRPVRIGQRVMTIADPRQVEIEIRLPVKDVIPLQCGAETTVFLNIRPDKPLDGTLSYLAYRPEPGSAGVLAYRLKAALNDDAPPPRIGLSGTAKIYGRQVTLFYYIFRRPITSARQWLGW